MDYISQLGENARKSKASIANASTKDKNYILEVIAANLLNNTGRILESNKKDLDSARDNGISDAMSDRLRLTEGRIKDIIHCQTV